MSESTRDLFNRHRLRCTDQRVALYETLLECECHPTPEELYHLARPRVERLSRATVYNTLEAFCRAGLALKLPMTNGCCRYDGDTSSHLHLWFRESDEIEDVPVQLGQRLIESIPPELLAELEQELGVRVTGLSIELLATRAGVPCGAGEDASKAGDTQGSPPRA